MNKLTKRCIGNLDGQLALTVGKVYECESTTVGSYAVINDAGKVQAYPKHLFIDPQVVVGRLLSGKVGTPDIRHVAPMFHIGQVIDLRYGNDGLPNRIQVDGIVMNSDHPGEWFYGVILENTRKYTTMGEHFITGHMKSMTAPVYELDVIKRRYGQGFRWVGNYTEETAYRKLREFRRAGMFSKVEVREAYDRDGNFVTGKVALWIRYRQPLGIDKESLRDTAMTELTRRGCEPAYCGGHCGDCE